MKSEEKCRLCLGKRKNVRSIFETDGCIPYVDMITCIANVKIMKTEITEYICLTCRKKLKESYDFKNMIEASDLALHQDSDLKRIKFSNLDDLKIELPDSKEWLTNKVMNKNSSHIFDKCFNNNEKSVCYKDIVIKKIEYESNDENKDPKSVNVHDFLSTLKEESCEDENDNYELEYFQDNEINSDDDYDIPIKRRLKKQINKKIKAPRTTASKTKLKFTGFKTVLIKPVILNDIGILRKRLDETLKEKKKYDTYRYVKIRMCSYCGKMTRTLDKHLLTHTGSRTHKCEICSKAFFTYKDLNQHRRRSHAADKKFKCDQCLAKFSTKESLKKHMDVHKDARNFVCEICSKAFKRKNALKRHVMIHSAASKTIKCELCNMSFITKYNLRHHLRVHTGERPYRCEMCSQGYSYKHDFNRHCLKKHGVFFKRRSVYIMNEEVLQKERELMRKLMLKVHGFSKDDEPLNAFEEPQAYIALEQTMKLLENKQIPIDFNL